AWELPTDRASAHETDLGSRSALANQVAGTTRGRPKVTQQLREFLRRRLPDHMIPTDFVWMDRLPLTPNGKLNRQVLPTPPQRRIDLTGSYSPPRSDVESRVASIWSQALGVDHIGIDTNFFDLGGHSLLLVRVHEQLK